MTEWVNNWRQKVLTEKENMREQGGRKEKRKEEMVPVWCADWLISSRNIRMVQIHSSVYSERIDGNRSLKNITIKTISIWSVVNLSNLFFSNKFSVEKVWWWYPRTQIFPLMHIDTWESNVVLQIYLANRKHLCKSFNLTTTGLWGQ